MIAVINDCDDDLYYIHCEYYLSNTPIGGWRVAILEGIPSPCRKLPVHDLLAEDFRGKSDLSTMRVEFYAGLKMIRNSQRVSLLKSMPSSETYTTSLSGSKSAGFEVTSIRETCLNVL